jgi:hypothetical protein
MRSVIRRLDLGVARAAAGVRGWPAPSQRDRNVQKRGRELIALVTQRLPLEYSDSAPADRWQIIGTALLSRMTTTYATVLDLQRGRLEADSSTLTRSLYEHTVHFAWLAADPRPARLGLWHKEDLVQRLKADGDTTAHGVQMLTPAKRAGFEQQRDAVSGDLMSLADLAIAADKHWAGKLKGLQKHNEPVSLSGFYSVLYRSYSAIAHPSEMGLQRVTDAVRDGRVRVQIELPTSRRSGRSGPWGIAGVVYTIGLLAASESLGWPDPDKVFAIYDKYQ